MNSEADQPVGKQTAAVHEEVHHVGVICVLHPAQARFHHGKAGLHEHDQKAGNERPNKVDGNLVLPYLVGNIGKGNAGFGIRRRDIVDGAGYRATRVALGQICGSGRFGGSILEFSRRG